MDFAATSLRLTEQKYGCSRVVTAVRLLIVEATTMRLDVAENYTSVVLRDGQLVRGWAMIAATGTDDGDDSATGR